MKEYNRLMKNRLSLKKYWISLFAVCFILPLLFSSCNFDSDGGSKDNASYGYVTFSSVTLPGNFDHVVQREASRDIVPSMDTAVLSDLKLTGKAKNADGSYPSGAATTVRTAQTLSALNEDASAHKIKLRTGTWSLTLSASYEGITYSGTVETVIQEDETNSLSFALTPVLEDGKNYYGGVNLTVKYKGEATKAVLTLKSEDEATTYLTQELEIQSLSADPEDYDGKVEVIRSLSDAAERLVTGTYSLSIDFYGNETRDLYLNTYKENLVISPSLTSTETRKIYLNEIYSITYYVGALKVSQISDISFASSAPAVYSIRSEITLPSLVRIGFTFKEWRAGSETGPVIEKIDTGTIRSNSYFNGRAKDVELYAKWDGEPFARVNETFLSTKDEVISLLENAGAGDELEIYFYGGAALTDIGKSSSSGTISYAIKNTNAAAVSVDLTEIKKSTNYNDTTFDFKECTKLKSFVNSAFSTYSIMSNMCEGCTALETVKIYPANIKIYPHAFNGCTNLREVIFIDRENSSCTSIGYDAFFNCTALENFDFPPKVSSVGNYAFYGCSSLESVTFSSTAEAESFSIGDYGFQNCTSLKSVILPENIVKIGQDCFRNCPALEEITFKDTEYLWDFNAQSYVGGGVYEDVHLGYLRVNNPAKNAKYFSEIFTYEHSYSFQSNATKTDKTEIETTLKTGLFLNYLIKEICAGKSIKSFEPSSSFPEAGGTMPDEKDIYFLDDADDGDIKAWVSGDKLYYYSAENSLNGAKIKANPRSNKIFWECSWFEKIDLSPVDFSEATTFENTFSGCTVLNNLILPDSMKTSNLVSMYGMFQNCKAIQNVSFPLDYDFSKVENLGYLFSNAIALRSVSFPSGITTENLTNMGNMFRTCSSLENIDLSGFDTSKVTDMGYTFSECTSLETITLSDKFTASSLEYAGKMFANCSSLESLDLTHFTNAPDSEKLTRAGHMFDGCSNLKTLTLPSYLRIKGNVYDGNYNSGINYLFNDCKELTTINNLDKLDVEGTIYLSDVFSNCKKLTSIDISTFKIGGSGIENVYITGMFYGCSSLTSITLPSTIGAPGAPVGLNALFADCTSLTDLSFLADSEIYSKKSLSSLFRNCTGLTSIVIPKSFHMVKTGSDSYVTWHMFNGCTNLKYIDISVLGMDDSLGSTYENYGLCLNCNSLETIVVGPDTKLLFKMYAPYNSSSSANPITGQVGTKNTSDDTSLYKTDSADSPGYFTSVYSVFVSGSDAAPAGSDTDGDGTKLKPFASITKAVEKINERITAGEDASGGEDTATTESRAYFTPGWSIIVKGNVPTNIELGEVKATRLLIQGTAYGATSSDPHGAENCILSGGNTGRIMNVAETMTKPLEFKNIKLTGARITDASGGAIYIGHAGCDVTIGSGTEFSGNFARAGACIYTKGDLTVQSGTVFTNNQTDTQSSSAGGVIYANANETSPKKITINGGLFQNNQSPVGAILVSTKYHEIEINDGTFKNNQASGGSGGAFYVYGNLTINDGTIGGTESGEANSADFGGAIYGGANSSITIKGGNISGNIAAKSGGAVYTKGTLTMTGGTISGNQATVDGGGIYTLGTFTMSGGAVSANRAGSNGGGVYTTSQMTMSGSAIIGAAEIDGVAVNTAAENAAGKYSNYAGKNGGGIYLGVVLDNSNSVTSYGTFTMNGLDCGVYYNYAAGEDDSGGNGGGIYCGSVLSTGSLTTIQLTKGTVGYNASFKNGGGICLGGTKDGLSTSTYATIIGNETKDSVSAGGGIYCGSNSYRLNLEGGNVTKNKSPLGGGLFLKKYSFANILDNTDTSGAIMIFQAHITENVSTENLGGAIGSERDIFLKGSLSSSSKADIPMGNDNSNDIYLYERGNGKVSSDSDYEPWPYRIWVNDYPLPSDNCNILVNFSVYKAGYPVLKAGATYMSYISASHQKFILGRAGDGWCIASDGILDLTPTSGFTISGPTYTSNSITVTVNSSDTTNYVFTAPAGYSKYYWSVEDKNSGTPSASNTFTLAKSELSIGKHTIIVICFDSNGTAFEGKKTFTK